MTNSDPSITIRDASVDDIPSMKDLIFTHGSNQWNYLPVESVNAHLGSIGGEEVFAVVAVDDKMIVGFASFYLTTEFSKYEGSDINEKHGYIAELVVHKSYVGQGIGTLLLEESKLELIGMGMNSIYCERHEENIPSATAMHKAGFQQVDVFYDPKRRPTGSRKTAVCRYQSKR